jgi:hypothetical protein
MSSFLQTLRFFTVVRPVPRLTRFAFLVITVTAAMALLMSGARDARVLLPILVLQTFTTSTGFIAYARRGHFDVLLTGGASRLIVAATYWALAAAPGAACWATLALVDLLAHDRASLLSAGSIAAVIGVSTIPWATTVPMTRFAGAIGWLLILVLVAGLTPVGDRLLWGTDGPSPYAVVTAIVFPGGLVGRPLHGNVPAIAVLLAVALTSMAAAFAWITRADFALETGQ